MASTAIMSALGFVFWVFVAHLYNPADIGVAATLISISTLVSNFSLLGLNSGIVRFLSASKQPSRDINAAALTVAAVTILAAAIYAFIVTHFGGSIALLNSPWHKLAFIGLMCAVSLNSLTDAVFIANRRGEYHTIGYATFGAVKLILPLVLVPFGAVGIYGAYILAMLASLLISYYLMLKGCNYVTRSKPNWRFLKNIWRYTVHNYMAVVIAGLPAQLMPLFIVRNLGAASAGYFSMAWTMANLLYVVPSAATQSLLAESAFDSRRRVEQLKRTIRLLIILLVPAVSVAVLISPYMLDIFGDRYRIYGTTIFQIFAISTFFIAISSVCNTILNLRHRTRGIVVAQSINLIVTFVSATMLYKHGLTGIGLSMLYGYIASCLCHLVNFWAFRGDDKKLPQRTASDATLTAAVGRNSQAALTNLGRSLYSSAEESPYYRVVASFLKYYNLDGAKVDADIGGGDRSATVVIHYKNKKYVLKAYSSSKISLHDLHEEIKFMYYLRTHGVSTPRVLPNVKRALVSKARFIDRSTKKPDIIWYATLLTHEPGRHPDSLSPTVIRSMAITQARLHNNGVQYARQPGEIARVKRQRSLNSLLLGWLPCGITHYDYYPGNVLVADDKVSCVLDFDGMRLGPLAICLLFTLIKTFDYVGDESVFSTYIRAYQTIRKLSTLEKLTIRCILALRYRSITPLAIAFT